MIRKNAMRLVVSLFVLTLFSASEARSQDKGFQEKFKEKAVWESVGGAALDEECLEHADHTYVDQQFRLAASDRQTLSRSAFPTLRIEGSRNDSIKVRGSNQSEITLVTCKMAAAREREEAIETLKQISVSKENGKVTSQGPASRMRGEGQFWRVQFIVYVPKDLSLELAATNGGIALADLEGKVIARVQNGGIALNSSGGSESVMELYAQNGGIALKEVQGKVYARTQNGGISFSEGSGDIKLESSNGGIVIQLPEGGWRGEGLEARSGNGGLILRVPSGFSSGIEAETSAHTPLDCRLAECSQDEREPGYRRKRVKIGDSSPLVRVSTNNGQLQILPAR